jgi:hypothetical protein
MPILIKVLLLTESKECIFVSLDRKQSILGYYHNPRIFDLRISSGVRLAHGVNSVILYASRVVCTKQSLEAGRPE